VQHSGVLFGFADGKPGFGFQRVVGQGGLELATLPDDKIEKLRRDFVESFTYLPMEAGEYDVVFAPEVSGLLAHESFGHGVEMDQFVKDRAKAREFLGKPVAAPIVSLYDDPSIAGARGSYPFDDEGVVAAPTKIIDAGTFVQPLTDLMSATFLGTKRTPNGRTQGFDRKVYARMSNTFIGRGETPPEQVLASLDNGLYLEGFRNGIEDPQGWGIQFTAGVAREYKGGKRTGRVFATPNVTGYVPDILNAITLVGSDFALEPGSCGKGFKEFVAVTSGGPHLRTRARVS
jgi:TldD protein